MTLEVYLSYLAVLFVFFATPPDTSQLLTISNSVRFGLKKSSATIAGDLTANAIQMTAAAFGLAAAISASAGFFQAVKWAGVAYLAFIGVRLILSRPPSLSPSPSAKTGGVSSLFQQGFVTSSVNPLAIAFFAALFPQFINHEGDVARQLLILGATYLLVDGLILVLWGALAVRAFSRIKNLTAAWLNRICGGFIILAAAYLAANDLSGNHGE